MLDKLGLRKFRGARLRLQHPSRDKSQAGFSLVELAVVLTIVALLTGGLLLGISSQRSISDSLDAQRQLDNIREALLGYAIANGRLPCPAQADLRTNIDDKAGEALVPPCDGSLQHGVLPWKTLGLPETDPWGNRFTYFASNQYTGLPSGGTQSSFTIATGVPPNSTANLASIRDSSAATSNIASDIPAVVVSHGRKSTGAYRPTGDLSTNGTASDDEKENSNSTLIFVARTPNESYDDLVTWIVPSVLKAKMVAAGRLP